MATINRGLNKPEEEPPPVSYLPVDSGNSLPSTVDVPPTTVVPSSDADAEGEVNNVKTVDEDGGYINASYVGGLLEGWVYIVTQGTMDSTLVDFWAMVWQEKVKVW